MESTERKQWLERENKELSLRKQCELLSLSRSSIYVKKQGINREDIELINEIRQIWESYPFYGYRKITCSLRAQGRRVNRKKVQRLMRKAGIKALYAKPKTSIKDGSNRVYPYLLKEEEIIKPNQAWQVDITYLRHGGGFMYLVALIDVYSRYVVGWSLSNTLDTQSCLEALEKGLGRAKPEIVNSDQGCQFTSTLWIERLILEGIKVSMTGKGRCHDNIYIERFWRSVKQEEFYLNEYKNVGELKKAIEKYIDFYNHTRWHQSLGYKVPDEFYFSEEVLTL